MNWLEIRLNMAINFWNWENCFLFYFNLDAMKAIQALKMFSLSSQIEYIVGHRWNAEYNKWLDDFWLNHFIYHSLSRVNWTRELKKLQHNIVNCINTYGISSHPDLTWDIISANPDKPWVWWCISANPNITWDIINANPDKPWVWWCISANPNITWDIIQSKPDKLWDWSAISENPNITWDIIKDNPGKPWGWDCVSVNPNITWDIIQAIPKKSSNWRYISMNPNITWDIIQANPDKPWVWDGISQNPNITFDIIRANPDDEWNDNYLASNKFTVQARISMAKHRVTTSRMTNYLARYIWYRLVRNSLEYGY